MSHSVKIARDAPRRIGFNKSQVQHRKVHDENPESSSPRRDSLEQRLARSLNFQDIIPIEQLYDVPNLPDAYLNKLSRKDLTKLREFKMPISPFQIKNSLEKEFGSFIKKTNWKLYSTPKTSLNVAYRMILQKLFYINGQQRLLKKLKATSQTSLLPLPEETLKLANEYSASTSDIITQESALIEKELSTKDYSRYTGKSLLQDTFNASEISDLPIESQRALTEASVALGKNASLHPFLKSESLKIIHNILQFSNKKSD